MLIYFVARKLTADPRFALRIPIALEPPKPESSCKFAEVQDI